MKDNDTFDELLKFPWTKEGDLNKQEALVNAFEEMKKRSGKRKKASQRMQELYVATCLLLEALNAKQLTWEQLKQLIVFRIDYCLILRELGNSPHTSMSESERFSGVREFYSGYPEPLSYHRVSWYIDTVNRLTRILIGRTGQQEIFESPSGLIAPSAEEWMGRVFLADRFERDHELNRSDTHRARIVETNLLADRNFIEDLKTAKRMTRDALGRRNWLYGHPEDTVVAVDKHGRSSPWVGPPLPPHVVPSLKEFCRTWCLSSVSNTYGSAEGYGMHITVLRPEVGLRADRMGITVLIPRYYKWSDIRNYRDVDFLTLKTAMQALCGVSRLQVKKPAGREHADRLMTRLRTEGDDARTAWEKTRRVMGWKVRTMEDAFGRQPRK